MLKLGDVILYLVLCMLLTTDCALGAELECPLDRIRLVHQDEVASSFVERSSVEFSNVISPNLRFSDGFFHSFDIPNSGQLEFDDDFVLVGLTSQGFEVSYLYFVSNFTFQYSSTTDSSDFITYPIDVTASSINEVSLFFDKPILARQVRFLIHSASTSPSGIYYWKLRIFGCKKSEANEKAVTTISPTETQECSSIIYSTPHVIIVNETNSAEDSNGINAIVIAVSLILVFVIIAVVSGVGFTMWYCRRKGQKSSESSPKTSNSASTLNRVINTNNSTEDADLADNPMYSSYYNSSIIELANSLAAAGTSYIPPERTLSIASRSQSIIATSSLRVEDEIESTHNMCYAVI